jgi:histidyl-tRNA synthetase
MSKITVIKTPLGTIDFGPDEANLREQLLEEIRLTFKKYGGVPLETPTFERREYLMKKYGDDAKLIFELKDSESPEDSEKESLCLRYDLTVPLARYLAQNNIVKLRRYQIAKVFRKDQPYLTKARFREFYQCDFDIIGEPETMIPEIQLLKIGQEILERYQINFKIRFNFRNNLIEILRLAQIPQEKLLTTCSSLDKLDKKSWSEISDELFLKGLNDTQIDSMRSLLDQNYMSESTKKVYGKFLTYAKTMQLDQFLQYDLYLARGMDYYTGLIFEFVVPDAPEMGSFMAGGRYDNLTKMFKESLNVPAIGLSVGFERLFNYLSKNKSKMISTLNVSPSIYLASITKDQNQSTIDDVTQYKLEIYNQLLKNFPKYRVILDSDEKRPLSKQISAALEAQSTYLVLIGQKEYSHRTVTVKDLLSRKQTTFEYDEFVQGLFIDNVGSDQ